MPGMVKSCVRIKIKYNDSMPMFGSLLASTVSIMDFIVDPLGYILRGAMAVTHNLWTMVGVHSGSL